MGRGKNIAFSTVCRASLNGYLSLPRTWFVLRLMSSWAHRQRQRWRRATATIPIVMVSASDPWLQVWLPVWRDREAMCRPSGLGTELNQKAGGT
jgi:hypothetical protein